MKNLNYHTRCFTGSSKQAGQTKIALSKVGEVWSAMKVAGKEFVEADRISNAYIGLIEKGQVVKVHLKK